MKKRGIIVFDVSGTIHKIGLANILYQKDTLLEVLVQRIDDNHDEPIFINRDAGLFRWIAYFYQCNNLVEPDDIPYEIWEDELKYFGLLEVINNQHKKAKSISSALKHRKERLEQQKQQHLRYIEEFVIWMIEENKDSSILPILSDDFIPNFEVYPEDHIVWKISNMGINAIANFKEFSTNRNEFTVNSHIYTLYNKTKFETSPGNTMGEYKKKGDYSYLYITIKF